MQTKTFRLDGRGKKCINRRLALDLRLPRKFRQVRQTILKMILPPSRTTSWAKLLRTFLGFCFKGCSTHSQGFRKVYRIKCLRVNKAHYQFYTVSLVFLFFFFPIQIIIVCERADTKEQLPGFTQVQFPSDHFNGAW